MFDLVIFTLYISVWWYLVVMVWCHSTTWRVCYCVSWGTEKVEYFTQGWHERCCHWAPLRSHWSDSHSIRNHYRLWHGEQNASNSNFERKRLDETDSCQCELFWQYLWAMSIQWNLVSSPLVSSPNSPLAMPMPRTDFLWCILPR